MTQWQALAKDTLSKRGDIQRIAGKFMGMMKYLSFETHVATFYLCEEKGMFCERSWLNFTKKLRGTEAKSTGEFRYF